MSLGFPRRASTSCLAHAALLQDDSDRALDEAARADPCYAGYAQRIRAKALAAQGDVPAAQNQLLAVLMREPGNDLAWSDLAADQVRRR